MCKVVQSVMRYYQLEFFYFILWQVLRGEVNKVKNPITRDYDSINTRVYNLENKIYLLVK